MIARLSSSYFKLFFIITYSHTINKDDIEWFTKKQLSPLIHQFVCLPYLYLINDMLCLIIVTSRHADLDKLINKIPWRSTLSDILSFITHPIPLNHPPPQSSNHLKQFLRKTLTPTHRITCLHKYQPQAEPANWSLIAVCLWPLRYFHWFATTFDPFLSFLEIPWVLCFAISHKWNSKLVPFGHTVTDLHHLPRPAMVSSIQY